MTKLPADTSTMFFGTPMTLGEATAHPTRALSALATGPPSEVVERGEHLTRLSQAITGEAGELGEDSGLDEWRDGSMRVLGCDRQLRRDPGGVDNGLADQQIGQPPGRCAAPNLNFAVPDRTNSVE